MPLPSRLTLDADSVHLRAAELNAQRFPPEHFWSSLSDDEQARAQRFATETLRCRFIIARGLLRALLGAYVQKTPADLHFAYREKGKPYLLDTPEIPDPVCFNMSHSQTQVLYALAPFEVGVDIEVQRDSLRYEQLTRMVLSPTEQTAWQQLPTAQRQHAFFRLWTRKEALLKAAGCGLAGNMRTLTLPLSAHALALHHVFIPVTAHPWTLYDLPHTRRSVACLVSAQIPKILTYKVL